METQTIIVLAFGSLIGIIVGFFGSKIMINYKKKNLTSMALKKLANQKNDVGEPLQYTIEGKTYEFDEEGKKINEKIHEEKPKKIKEKEVKKKGKKKR